MKKLKNKAFTLIELLVVVAIIGILAAVGVTTFGGFQDKAKVSASKAIHKGVQKKLAAELVKCSLGDTTILNSLSCTGITGTTVINNIGDAGAVFTDKNPYVTANFAVKKGGSANVAGQTSISASGQNIYLKTCTKTGCASADQITDTVTVE
nr:type II secretion system protein [Candidatus Pelagibacter bacterium]